MPQFNVSGAVTLRAAAVPDLHDITHANPGVELVESVGLAAARVDDSVFHAANHELAFFVASDRDVDPALEHEGASGFLNDGTGFHLTLSFSGLVPGQIGKKKELRLLEILLEADRLYFAN